MDSKNIKLPLGAYMARAIERGFASRDEWETYLELGLKKCPECGAVYATEYDRCPDCRTLEIR